MVFLRNHVIFCEPWRGSCKKTHVLKIKISKSIYYGLSLGVDEYPEYDNFPFRVTAFPSTVSYWRTSVAPCQLIGTIIHP